MILNKRIILFGLLIFFLKSAQSQNISKAYQLYEKKEYKQAIDIFRNSISKKKETLPSKYGLALIYADTNYYKYKYRLSYKSILYVQKRFYKLPESDKLTYSSKYGLNASSVNELRSRILDGAFLEACNSGSVEKMDEFIYVYKDSAINKKAVHFRNEMVFKNCLDQNNIDTYQAFLKKYPKSQQADSVKKIIESLIVFEYEECAASGELEPFLKFVDKYPGFIYPERLKRDLGNAYLADKLDLDKTFSYGMLSVYETYIKKAAPTELAFVALQRILTPELIQRDWSSAIEILEEYESYFPDDERINKTIQMLGAAGEKIQKENISTKINTNGHEYAPVISASGKRLYFCGRKREGSIGGEDIFVSKFINNSWTEPELIRGINTPYAHEAPLAISADGNRLLLYANTDIYYSDKTYSGWGIARPFPSVNTEKSWEADAMMTSDGNAILFISDRKGNIGQHHVFGKNFHGSYAGNLDIYVSEKTEDGWSKPVNIGEKINTPYAERSPFLHPDMKTLYFSSDGHAGLGKLDVFKTTRLNDTSWTEWSEPVNLGKEINSFGDEYDYKISTDGKMAYLSVFETDNYDIYQMELPVSMRPEAVAVIFGTIKNSDEEFEHAKIKWEDLTTGKLIGFSESDINDGSYLIILPLGKNYGYYIDHKNYFPLSGNVDLTNQKEQIEIEKNFVLRSYVEIINNQVAIPLENVFFEHNKYQLRPESYLELNRLVTFIKKNEGLKIEISGHTDNTGTTQYNKQLSKKRADAVKNYLIKQGCKQSNLSSVGYGESHPVTKNDTEEGKAKNRRVEFRVVK
ncbi:MAG: OmpA family protein [Bacteroidota bacterium]